MFTERFYTRKEVGEVLRVSRETVRRLQRTGKLPDVRVGRRSLIPERALKEMIDSQMKLEANNGQSR